MVFALVYFYPWLWRMNDHHDQIIQTHFFQSLINAVHPNKQQHTASSYCCQKYCGHCLFHMLFHPHLFQRHCKQRNREHRIQQTIAFIEGHPRQKIQKDINNISCADKASQTTIALGHLMGIGIYDASDGQHDPCNTQDKQKCTAGNFLCCPIQRQE